MRFAFRRRSAWRRVFGPRECAGSIEAVSFLITTGSIPPKGAVTAISLGVEDSVAP